MDVSKKLDMRIILITIMLLIVFLGPVAHAQEAESGQTTYQPMTNIPVVGDNLNLESIARALYIVSVSLAALLAVIKIVIGGSKYMLSDVVTDKGEAKKDIRGAIIGLLIVIGAVLLLEQINPDLTNTSIFKQSVVVPGGDSSQSIIQERPQGSVPGNQDPCANDTSGQCSP